LGALHNDFFSHVSIPASHIYGINEDLISVSTAAVAEDYEPIVRKALDLSGGQLDLAVLGFGPDGHTCSLFPGHALLHETSKWVAPIEDSPKPPPRRITLTFPVLNSLTRHVIFCGAGESKSPILQGVFATVTKTSDSTKYSVHMSEPAPFPCGMVLPNSPGVDNSLTWVVDAEALAGVTISE
jgi:6-phosphogluconolactonase